MMAENLSNYWQKVQRLASRRDGGAIFNGSPDHAAIIVERMFAHAKQHIWILTNKLDARIFGVDDTLEEARQFLADSDHHVRILMESQKTDDLKYHPFFEEFSEHTNLEVRRVPEPLQEGYNFHAVLMDEDSYRFEAERGTQAAVAAFGEPKGATNLKEAFEKIWNDSFQIHFSEVA